VYRAASLLLARSGISETGVCAGRRTQPLDCTPRPFKRKQNSDRKPTICPLRWANAILGVDMALRLKGKRRCLFLARRICPDDRNRSRVGLWSEFCSGGRHTHPLSYLLPAPGTFIHDFARGVVEAGPIAQGVQRRTASARRGRRLVQWPIPSQRGDTRRRPRVNRATGEPNARENKRPAARRCCPPSGLVVHEEGTRRRPKVDRATGGPGRKKNLDTETSWA
jgi:hypothetical protein